jgi:hypothetical protein
LIILVKLAYIILISIKALVSVANPFNIKECVELLKGQYLYNNFVTGNLISVARKNAEMISKNKNIDMEKVY